MIYIAVFLISILFLEFAFLARNKSVILYKLCIAASVIIPCLTAALRADSVGTDTRNYVSIFRAAVSSADFSEYFRKIQSYWSIGDVMFLFVNYIVSKFTTAVEVELFIQEVLVIAPIYAALLMMSKNKNHAVLGAAIFYMFCYSISLNMVRQSIALSFEVLALAFLEKDNKKSFVVFSLLGALFHNTAIIVYAIYLLFWFVKTKAITSKIKSLIIVFMIIIAIIAVINFDKLLTWVYSLNLVDFRFYAYIFNFSKAAADIEWSSTFIYASIIILILINKKKLSENLKYVNFYLMLSIFGLILLQVGVKIEFAQRIAFYFCWPCLFIALPELAIENSSRMRYKELICHLFIFSIFLSDIVWRIFINNGHETLPYIFR